MTDRPMTLEQARKERLDVFFFNDTDNAVAFAEEPEHHAARVFLANVHGFIVHCVAVKPRAGQHEYTRAKATS